MDTNPEPQTERAWHLSGAPALLSTWFVALIGATQVTGGRAHFTAAMAGGAVRALGGVVALLGVGALGLRLWAFMRRRGVARPEDEGRGLRVLAGAVTTVGAFALLGGSWLGWAFGVRDAPHVYGDLGWVLGRTPGVWFAVVCIGGAGLYLAEELPRAAAGLGWAKSDAAHRVFVLLGMVAGAALFLASLNVITHYSVGQALMYRIAQ